MRSKLNLEEEKDVCLENWMKDIPKDRKCHKSSVCGKTMTCK
jgi:hypothetical protein